MARLAGKSKIVDDDVIVIGKDFAMARYDFTPRMEDAKNRIVSLSQVVIEGERLLGMADLQKLDRVSEIGIDGFKIAMSKSPNPLSDDLPQRYDFLLPLQFFMKGGRTGNDDWERTRDALKRLGGVKVEFTKGSGDTYDEYCGTLFEGLVFKHRKVGGVKTVCVAFSMIEPVLNRIYDLTRGYFRYYEDDCCKLSSVYAKRVYQMLCSQKVGQKLSFGLSNFKSMFKLDGKYENIRMFEKRILEPLVKDISENTRIVVDFGLRAMSTGEDKYAIDFVLKHNYNVLKDSNVNKQLALMGINKLDERFQKFLEREVRMTKDEISRNYMDLNDAWKVSEIRQLLDEKWELAKNRCNTERDRKAYFVGTIKAMLEDSRKG